MTRLGLLIRQFFCPHNDIRYWESEELFEILGTYRIHKATCMRCGLKYTVKERIK